MIVSVDNFNARGSGFVLDRIKNCVIVITQFRPLARSTYIPTPPSIERKKAVINVKNNDERCFEWAILSGLYPPKSNPLNGYSYTKYRDTLNFDGISFPVHLKYIPKLQKQNPQISVNVISLDDDSKGFSIDYLSPERHRPHHINLLLIQNTTTQHYVYISHFSRFSHPGGRRVRSGRKNPYRRRTSSEWFLLLPCQ